MADYVSAEAKRAARKADLFDFLITHHSDAVVVEGNSLRLRNDGSITLKRGYSGWKDWATDEGGNGIDLLMRYFGYSFQEAVTALAGDYIGIATPAPQVKPKLEPQAFALPSPLQDRFRQLFAYLTQTRKLPADVVNNLIQQGLMYQEAGHANIVFVNPDRTFAELRGTNTFKAFHQVMFSDPAAYWWFCPSDEKSGHAFVCESAIDAISLSLLMDKYCKSQIRGMFCSIGGVANQQRIDRIKNEMQDMNGITVMAVDNDEAGEACRLRNPDCPAIVPTLKDWNDCWQAGIKNFILTKEG